jgi:hypothetical protein
LDERRARTMHGAARLAHAFRARSNDATIAVHLIGHPFRRLALFAPLLGIALFVGARVLLHAVPTFAAAPAASASASASARPTPREPDAKPAEPPGPRPEHVQIGVYVRHVPEVDLRANTYVADFYLWFLWKGDIDPTQTFEITNAVDLSSLAKIPAYVDESGAPKPDELPDGRKYQVLHVQSRLWHAFPITDYPFDTQDIVIDIEDARHPSTELVYEPDSQASGYKTANQIPGWVFVSSRVEARESKPGTSFGDPRPRASNESYSKARFALHIKRPVAGLMAKVFLPLAIIVLITFCAFLVSPDNIDARLGLLITALISDAALQYTTSNDLPSSGYLVLMDKIYILSYVVIFIGTFLAIVAARRHDAEREADARRLDKQAVAGLAVLFFGGSLYIILAR